MKTTSTDRWVAIASAPADQVTGTVTLHAWDGAHELGEAVASIELDRPSWLEWGADGGHLHVACESEQGHVVTLMVDLSGDAPSLAEVGRVPSGGANPCHLALSEDGLTLFAANYADGTVSTVEVRDGVVTDLVDVDRLTGSGPHPSRQSSSHAHQVVPSWMGTAWSREPTRSWRMPSATVRCTASLRAPCRPKRAHVTSCGTR